MHLQCFIIQGCPFLNGIIRFDLKEFRACSSINQTAAKFQVKCSSRQYFPNFSQKLNTPEMWDISEK
jgi:hypothetical protein